MLNTFFFENRAIYEIKWKNVVEPDRPHRTIRCVHIAWWIPKATGTHSKYVILLVHCNNGCKAALQCYVIRRLPVLFLLITTIRR